MALQLTESQQAYAACIRTARAEAGLTQEQLSQLCGGSPSRVTISRIETHESRCSAETFASVATALKLTLRVLNQRGSVLATIGPVKAVPRRKAGRKAS